MRHLRKQQTQICLADPSIFSGYSVYTDSASTFKTRSMWPKVLMFAWTCLAAPSIVMKGTSSNITVHPAVSAAPDNLTSWFCYRLILNITLLLLLLSRFSRVRLLTTPWTAAHQAAPSMGFARQEYWSGVPLPSPNIILGSLKFFRLPTYTLNSLVN